MCVNVYGEEVRGQCGVTFSIVLCLNYFFFSFVCVFVRVHGCLSMHHMVIRHNLQESFFSIHDVGSED